MGRIKILLATKRIVQLDIKANMQVTRGSMKSNAVLKKTTSVATARVMVSSGVLNTRSVSNTNQRVNQRVFTGSLGLGLRQAVGSSTKHDWRVNAVIQDGAKLDRPLRVAIVGGGPAGACAAEECAKNGCETYMIERKRDEEKGTNVINGLFMGMEQKEGEKGPWTMQINEYTPDGDQRVKKRELAEESRW